MLNYVKLVLCMYNFNKFKINVCYSLHKNGSKTHDILETVYIRLVLQNKLHRNLMNASILIRMVLQTIYKEILFHSCFIIQFRCC